MNELWRELRIGDHVQVVSWPVELVRERLHRETIELYEWLLETGTKLIVKKFDHLGIPYGEVRRKRKDEIREVYEYIGLNHSGICVKSKPVLDE